MHIDDLATYEERERDFVRLNGAKAVADGFVNDATKIYCDQGMSSRLAFCRSGAPLAALLLLYEETVVYIPPSTKEAIEARLRLNWEDMLMLVDRGCIRPIIGHPLHYARKAHFNDLLSFKPPSVWARGDELARRFASGDEYWALAREVVPIEEMSAEPWIQAKWRKHFPNLSSRSLLGRIQTEIYTNFVDLCIYGYEPIARDLAALPDRAWGARRILELSELLTYPTLMGLGGTANYGLATASAVEEAMRHEYLGNPDIRVLGPEIDILLEGLAINVPTDLDPELVVQFHEDGMAHRLWRSLEELELQVAETRTRRMDALVDSAVTAEQIVQSTMREVKSIGYGARRARTEKLVRPWTDLSLKVGSAAALAAAARAPLGNDWMNAALAGVGATSLLAALKKFDDITAAVEGRVVDLIAERRTSKLATQLWWLSDWRRRQQGISTRLE
jgi:hypothetical protein